MYKNHSVGAVIPAYNESIQIKIVIESIPKFVDYILMFDDCSQDNTIDVVRQYVQDNDDRLYIIKHEKNQGWLVPASGCNWCRDLSFEMEHTRGLKVQ